ncbi:STAS domain-containing protein [Prauserella cavernicola]|uniref:STAS domain-containing protein n=1 Tax=Prauserella cavernicola TaxID=2800127 RepID=A0A934R052_9PSEU|nr:STAS domain-containing protein [Prauserella cavernicola]MBK1789425.1 STAS domain-containing protein [Prauserella cavernicola]
MVPTTKLTPSSQPQAFSVTRARPAEGCDVLTVVGELDLATAGSLATEFAGIPVPSTRSVVVDATRVEFCAVAGISALDDLRIRLDDAGVPLALSLSHAVSRPLDVLALLDVFSVHDTRAEALAAVTS